MACEVNPGRTCGPFHGHLPSRGRVPGPCLCPGLFRVPGRDLGRIPCPVRDSIFYHSSPGPRTGSGCSGCRCIFPVRGPYGALRPGVLFCLLQAFPFSLKEEDLQELFTDRTCRDHGHARGPSRGLWRHIRQHRLRKSFRRRRPLRESPTHGRGRPPSCGELRQGYVPPWPATRSSSLQPVRGKDLPGPPNAWPPTRHAPGKPLPKGAWVHRRA